MKTSPVLRAQVRQVLMVARSNPRWLRIVQSQNRLPYLVCRPSDFGLPARICSRSDYAFDRVSLALLLTSARENRLKGDFKKARDRLKTLREFRLNPMAG